MKMYNERREFCVVPKLSGAKRQQHTEDAGTLDIFIQNQDKK